MAKVTYTDKVSLAPSGSPDVNTWRDNDANEVKTVVNSNDTVTTSTSNTVKFDKIQGYRHGSWGFPIVGTIILNTLGAVEGGCAVVIWNGSESPTFSGGTIQSYSGNITESGTYSVYIHYLNGRFNVNVFNVEGYTEVPSNILFEETFAGTGGIDTSVWDVANGSGGAVVLSTNDKLIVTHNGSSIGAYPSVNILSKNIVNTVGITFNIQASFKTANANAKFIYFGMIDALSGTEENLMYQLDTAESVFCNVKDDGVYIADGNVVMAGVGSPLNTWQKVKIRSSGSSLTYWWWNGSSWDNVATKTMTSTTDKKVALSANYLAAQNFTSEWANIVASDTDYATEYPAGFTPTSEL